MYASTSTPFQCIGVYCTTANLNLAQSFEVSQSVTFIDVSQPATGYVGEPPIFLAKVPFDFFYPFMQDSSSSVHSSFLVLTMLLLGSLLFTKYLS